MIECKPAGICSCDYFLTGDGHSARLDIASMGELGFAEIDGAEYRIRKHGWLSGRWTISDHNGTLFEAKKLCAFSRVIEITLPLGGIATLSPQGIGRAMQLEAPEGTCRLAPVHPFTRRAQIEGTISDFRLVAFAFWLTSLLWRRANGGPGSTRHSGG